MQRATFFTVAGIYRGLFWDDLSCGQDYSVCPDFEGNRPGHAPHRVHPHSPFAAFTALRFCHFELGLSKLLGK